MGFMSPELPDVDPATWQTLPRATRLQIVTRHWVEHGFGTPYAAYLLYLFKIGVYIAAPAAIISLTPGLGGWATSPTGGANRSCTRRSSSSRCCSR
ncbi:hypothetical protein I546_2517 [Mycobacterium kansasii 732]|nr:hypothetical protein I546_2517 [Mycobacterium kansasii 732]